MIWDVILFDNGISLVDICGTLTAQLCIDDILQPDVGINLRFTALRTYILAG